MELESWGLWRGHWEFFCLGGRRRNPGWTFLLSTYAKSHLQRNDAETKTKEDTEKTMKRTDQHQRRKRTIGTSRMINTTCHDVLVEFRLRTLRKQLRVSHRFDRKISLFAASLIVTINRLRIQLHLNHPVFRVSSRTYLALLVLSFSFRELATPLEKYIGR